MSKIKSRDKPDAGAPLARGWSGRFSEPMSERMQRFNASVDFDRRLASADIAGSLAHARMLAATGVLSAADLAAIERGLKEIEGEIERGDFVWTRALEDVHLNIEHRLTALVGDAGKRLHTARSRNDQVATDARLWLRSAVDALTVQLRALRKALIDLAEKHAGTIMPGFTHLQVAQPVTFGHHLLAYEAMLARDAERLADGRRRINRLPLGSAALAGTSYPIDRQRIAEELGFEALCSNSLDAVSDRDFAVEFAAAAALIMVHLSRFAASEGFATATDLADYLVRKGIPFRDAHEAVARTVRHAEQKRRDLAELPLADLQRFAPVVDEDVFRVLTLEGSVASRDHPGGTAPAQVRAAAKAARAALDRT